MSNVNIFILQVSNAEKHGAIGALVFPDPSFSAQQGYAQDKVYPNGWWLPSVGVQEGTILFGPYNGDPQTPFLPSIKGIHRKPVNESELPKIPAQTISYGDALELLRRLGGNVVFFGRSLRNLFRIRALTREECHLLG